MRKLRMRLEDGNLKSTKTSFQDCSSSFQHPKAKKRDKKMRHFPSLTSKGTTVRDSLIHETKKEMFEISNQPYPAYNDVSHQKIMNLSLKLGWFHA